MTNLCDKKSWMRNDLRKTPSCCSSSSFSRCDVTSWLMYSMKSELQRTLLDIQRQIAESKKELMINCAMAFLDLMELEKCSPERMKELLALEKKKKSVWEMQEARCRRLRKRLGLWGTNGLRLASLKELLQEIHLIQLEAAKCGGVQDGKVNFSPELNRFVLAPSLQHTTLEMYGNPRRKALNVCVITVRDILNYPAIHSEYSLKISIVKDHTEAAYVVMQNLKNGSFRVTFYPTETGEHIIHVTLNSYPIACCPAVITVSDAPEVERPAIVFGSQGEKPGEFLKSWGLCCDGKGRILTSDRHNHRIQIFSHAGRFLGQFGKFGTGPGEFNRPTGITSDDRGRIIVADKDNHRIQIFDEHGGYLREFGSPGVLYYPWDVAADEYSRIAVTETKMKRVTLFTEDGNIVATCEFAMGEANDLPRGIAFCDTGFLVTGFHRHRLLLLDEQLENMKSFGSFGVNPSQFARPQGVAVSSTGLVAVADCRNYRIQIFKNNIPIRIIGEFGSEPGQFSLPQGVAFLPDDRLAVVDCDNFRIQIFDIL